MRRDFVVVMVMTIIPRNMKATVLIDHPKPIFGMSRVRIIGKMTPPNDEPDAMMPIAVSRFLINHVETAFIVA